MKWFCIKSAIVLTLMVSIVVPPPAYTQPTHAIFENIVEGLISGGGGERVTIVNDSSSTGITNTLKNVLSEISTNVIAGVQEQLKLKEFTLDSIAWSLAQEAMNAMTADILNWVNGGADGQTPAFITDLGEHLDTVAFKATEEFLNGPAIQELHPSQQAAVERAVVEHYRANYTDYEPNINEDIDVDAILAGDLSQGWGAFYTVFARGQNNPSSATRKAIEQLDKEIAEKQEYAITEANWGDGFLSKKDCDFIEDASGYPSEKCVTLTPGAIIRDTVAFVTGEQPFLRALEADEFNEVLGDLFSSLTSEALTGAMGLLGLGGNEAFTAGGFGEDALGSFLGALTSEVVSSGVSVALSDIRSAISREAKHAELQEEVVTKISTVKAKVDSYQSNSSCFELELSSKLASMLGESQQKRLNALEAKALLEEMRDIMNSSPSGADERLVAQQWGKLVTENGLQSERDNENLQLSLIEVTLEREIDKMERAIERELARCGGSGSPANGSGGGGASARVES